MILLSLSLLLIFGLEIKSTLAEDTLRQVFQDHPNLPAGQAQDPMMDLPGILMPGSSDKAKQDHPVALSISDVIGKERIINIFAGFTRDIDEISKRLDDNSLKTTVLAPLNSELQKLPRKPWEDPKDYDTIGSQAYQGDAGEDRAHKNLRRFVEAHVVPHSPWAVGEKVKTIGGGQVWWEEKAGQKLIQPGNIEVKSIADKVSNGEVWVLKGCINYE